MSRPGAVSHRRTHPFLWIAGLLGAFALGLYLWAGVLIQRHGSSRKEFGWEAARDGRAWIVRGVRQDGPAAQLADGDRIVAINGDPRVVGGLWLHLNPIPPGGSYTLRFVRNDAAHEITLTTRLRQEPAQLARIFALLPVGLTFLGIGLLAGILRPDETVARLLSLGCLGGSLNILQLVLMVFSDQLVGFENAAWTLAALFRPFERVLGFHFLLCFPSGISRGLGWKVLLGVFYTWAGLLWAWSNLLNLLYLIDPAQAAAVASAVAALGAQGTTSLAARAPLAGSTLGLPFLLLVHLAIPILALWTYRQVRQPDQLRRIRWVLTGAVGAFAPVALLDAAALISRATSRPDVLETAAFRLGIYLAAWATTLVPLTFAYAVLVHRILDVDRVIRRGMQYLLARNVLRLALLLPGVLLAASIVSRPELTIAEVFLQHPGHLLLIAAALTSLRFHAPLRDWLDRRFFRAAHDREHLLLNLVEEIKGVQAIPVMSRLVCERLDAALHPEHIHFFYRPAGQRHLDEGYSSGGEFAPLRIPETSDLLRLLEGQVAARDCPFPEGALAADEATWLEQLGIHLVVPIPAPDRRLAGLILLGAKKSEEPFGPTDRRLLGAVAGQVGIVWENAVLRARVDEQKRVQQEVLSHLDDRQMNLVRECPLCQACFDRAELTCPEDGAELRHSLPVERTIEARYRLDRLIGRGGMGAVYQAADLRLGRTVALKVLVGSLFGNSDALRRFEREARAAAQLRHPAIITVHDYGELAHGGAYLVMELLPGPTLRREIDERGNLEPALAAAWFGSIFEGVAAAHAAGVIHRDLKPENVLIARDEAGGSHAKVLDFGLAKVRLQEAEGTGLTLPGTVLGTLRYMSPEQIGGRELDERTDVFSLAVMLAEALTGRHPFPGRSGTEVVSAILNGSYHLEGDADPVRELDAALQRCLAKDRSERLGSVGEMRTALLPLIVRCPRFPLVPALPADATPTT